MKNCKSVMVKKLFCVLLCCGFVFHADANENSCAKYKKIPEINVERADWKTTVSQSDDDLWPRAGYVKIEPFSSFLPGVSYAFNGKYYCVILESVSVEIGFNDFNIFVDKKYEKDSCEYNAVLNHENHHINDAVAAFDKIFPEIEIALRDIVNDIEPVYTQDVDEIPVIVENMQNKIVKNESLKKLVDDFKEQLQSDAHDLDDAPTDEFNKCTADRVKKAFEKYNKGK